MKAAILTIFGLTAAEGLNDPFQDEQTINREFIELENLQEGDIKGYLPHKKLRGFRKIFWRYDILDILKYFCSKFLTAKSLRI